MYKYVKYKGTKLLFNEEKLKAYIYAAFQSADTDVDVSEVIYNKLKDLIKPNTEVTTWAFLGLNQSMEKYITDRLVIYLHYNTTDDFLKLDNVNELVYFRIPQK